MKEFEYIINDIHGMHARPAGMLVEAAAKFKSEIMIEKEGKTADAKRIFALMGLGIKSAQTIKVVISGEDEDEAAEEISNFLENNI